MEEQYFVYYCTICHICKKPAESSEDMKFCSGCKIIQYCGIKHQKQDWPNHRELCKGVQQITKMKKMSHVFEDASTVLPSDSEKWVALRSKVWKVVELTLRRRLKVIETQMFLFPPLCNYCHIYKVNAMSPCNDCKSVLYCSKEHQCEDKKHKSHCKSLARCFEVDIFRLHHGPAIYNFASFDIQCWVKDFPVNMKAFISNSLNLVNLTNKEFCLSESLSFVLTLVYVIKIMKVTANQLTLHIVGASSVELLAVQASPLIYHLFPHITHINIVLIGPEVIDANSIPLCIADSNISVSSVKLLYHDYMVSPTFVAPDIIAAMNCGFSEYVACPALDSWKQSLPLFLSFKNTVVTLTSYTREEAAKDLKRLCSFRKNINNVILSLKENPFASLYPHRDWENEEVFYANSYISVIKT